MTLLLFLSLNLLVTVVRLPVAGSSSEPAFFLKGIDYYLLPMDLLSLAFLMIDLFNATAMGSHSIARTRL